MVEELKELMQQYTTDNLVNISPADFQEYILGLINQEEQPIGIQREQSVNFVWGHNHDFGTFKVNGYLGDRHFEVVQEFLDKGIDFNGKSVIDVGCWTGGISLLLSALGARVLAIDEVEQYVEVIETMKYLFALKRIVAWDYSIYDLNLNDNHKQDLVMCAGVLYHLTDPIVALRIMFNQLKDGSKLLLETSIITDTTKSVCQYKGPSEGGYAWFRPSWIALRKMLLDVGFEEIEIWVKGNRAYVICTRNEWKDMLKAGLSREVA